MRKLEFILLLLLFSFIKTNAQPPDANKYLNFKAEVKYIDSQYIIHVRLNLTNDSIKIQLPKKLSINNESNEKFDCNVILLKKIKDVYVNMYVSYISQLGNDDEYYAMRDFKYGDTISTSTDIEYLCPLEIGGEYKVYVNLNYFYRGMKCQVLSDACEFKVEHDSKFSRWR